MGLLGNAGLNAPLFVYVSRWFDRRRGSALALISSGGYLAGFVWPTIFERSIAYFGWQLDHDRVCGPAARRSSCRSRSSFCARRPKFQHESTAAAAAGARPKVLGWHPNVVFVMIALAGFLCCVTMSMPQQHLVAFCSDLGISATRRRDHAVGAARHGLLQPPGLGLAVRPDGRRARRHSAARSCNAPAMSGFLFTQDPVGLFAVVDRVRARLQRAHSRLRPDHPRALPDERGALAGAGGAAADRQRHGHRRLARGLSLRHLRLLHAGLRHRRRLQHRQHRDPVHAAGAAEDLRHATR